MQDIKEEYITCPRYIYTRACLKNHFRNLQAPLCGIFYPHSVAVARYAALIRIKSPTNWDSQLTKSLFQTRSSLQGASIMKGWMKNENEMITGYSDGTRQVIFKIERIDYE